MPPQRTFFQKVWPWYLNLTLTDDFELGIPTKRSCHKIYSLFPIQRHGQCKSFLRTNNRKNGWTDKPMGQKLYALDLLMQGHKKQFSYNLAWKCEQCRSEIRLHILCSLISDLHCPQKLLVSSIVRKELMGMMIINKQTHVVLVN